MTYNYRRYRTKERVELGALIKAARIKKGLTQRQVAESIGVTGSSAVAYISSVENGSSTSEERYIKIFQLLNIPLDTKIPSRYCIEPFPSDKRRTSKYRREANNNLIVQIFLSDLKIYNTGINWAKDLEV